MCMEGRGETVGDANMKKPLPVEPVNPKICACPIELRGKAVGQNEFGDKIYHCPIHKTVELESDIKKRVVGSFEFKNQKGLK